MAKELSLFGNLSFLKNGAACADGPHRIKVDVRGSKFVKNTALVNTVDSTLDSISSGFTGYALFRWIRAIACPDTPTGQLAANVGTPGSTSYTYKIVAVGLGSVKSAASSAATTASGNATLNGSNFNRITWTAVDTAVSYDVYRTASAGTPSSTGKIGSSSTPTFDDTGLAGDSATAPAAAAPAGVADDTTVTFGDGSVYPVACKVDEFALLRPNFGAIHAITDVFPVIIEYTVFED